MTELDQHLEATAEGEHLRQTLDKLEQRIEEIGAWDVKGFEGNDAAALQNQLVKIYDGLVTARQ